MTLDLSIRPDGLLTPAALLAVTSTEDLAIVEIAGRDSVAAGIVGQRERGYTTLLPTVAKTATETGDRRAPARTVEVLRKVLGGDAEVLEPVTLGEPALWAAMNARFASEITRRYGMYSPCMACHLYLHLARVPLSWRLGRVPVVSGERDTHGGRVKLSQTPEAIDAAAAVLAYAGIELVEPVRDVAGGEEIAAIVGDAWDPEAPQLGCVLSGNYIGPDGAVRYDEAGYERYLGEFLRPVGIAVIDHWRALGWDGPAGAVGDAAQGEPDYEGIVRAVLAR